MVNIPANVRSVAPDTFIREARELLPVCGRLPPVLLLTTEADVVSADVIAAVPEVSAVVSELAVVISEVCQFIVSVTCHRFNFFHAFWNCNRGNIFTTTKCKHFNVCYTFRKGDISKSVTA